MNKEINYKSFITLTKGLRKILDDEWDLTNPDRDAQIKRLQDLTEEKQINPIGIIANIDDYVQLVLERFQFRVHLGLLASYKNIGPFAQFHVMEKWVGNEMIVFDVLYNTGIIDTIQELRSEIQELKTEINKMKSVEDSGVISLSI
jgi:hypothetical protein